MLIGLVLAFVGGASAGGRGVVVNVIDPDALLAGPTAEVSFSDVGGATRFATLANDGAPPDIEAGDALWAGRLDNVMGDAGELTLTSGGASFRATVSIHGGDTPSLSLRPAPDGGVHDVSNLSISDLVPNAPTSPSGQAPWNNTVVLMAPGLGGDETTAGAGVRPAGGWWIPWFMGTLALLGGVVWVRQLAVPVLPGVPLGRPAGGAPTRVAFDADPAVQIAALPVGSRTVYVGPALAADPPAGTVWWAGPGRPVVEDVLALVRHLGQGGAGVVVVVAGPIEGVGGRGGADAVDHLFSRLPPGTALHQRR
ncbi:MAG: hypothetical protein Q8P18_17275 [Pseudomonadota bacterium]|nr:hypothetical protein [Pseudomonadota bacterium]